MSPEPTLEAIPGPLEPELRALVDPDPIATRIAREYVLPTYARRHNDPDAEPYGPAILRAYIAERDNPRTTERRL